MSINSSINFSTQISDTFNTIGFTPLIDVASPNENNASLIVLPTGVPYNMQMGGTYNVTVDYIVDGLLFQRAFLIEVIDPCETEIVLPDFSLSPGPTVGIFNNIGSLEYIFSVAPIIPLSFSWCTFSFEVYGSIEPVPGQAYNYFEWQNRLNGTGTYSDLANMQFIVHNSTYLQSVTGANEYDFIYQVGQRTQSYIITFSVNDPCLNDFSPKDVINEIALMGSPQYQKHLAKSVFQTPNLYPFCHVWTKITITKLDGGTVNSALFQFQELNSASIETAEANIMMINFNSATAADCGDYEIKRVFYMIPEEYYTYDIYKFAHYTGTHPFLVTILPITNEDPCIAFTKIPRSKSVIWYVGLNAVENGTLMIYPMTNYQYLNCTYSYQALMKKDAGTFAAVSSYQGFIQADQSNANYANSMQGFVKGNFTYDKTLQGIYYIHVNYQWGTSSTGQQNFQITLEDPCPILMTPNKVENQARQCLMGYQCFWDHWNTRPNNFYDFCSVILRWTVTKTPPTYDTRLSLIPWMNNIIEKTGRKGEQFSYHTSYDWQKSGNYTIRIDIAYQSPGLHNYIKDHAANAHYQYQINIIDQCGAAFRLPTFANQTASIGNPTPLILNLAPSYVSSYSVQMCQASVAIEVTKDSLPFIDPVNFKFLQLEFATQAQLATSNITISTPYLTSLVGLYNIQVKYQVTQFDFKSLNITVAIGNACSTAFVPPLMINDQFLSTPDFLLIDIKPTIDPFYPWCTYSINLVATKTTDPNTTANVVQFENMVDKVLADITDAVITLTNSPYNISYIGVYNLQVTYSWSFPVLTQFKTFTLTVTDDCTTNITTNPLLTNQFYLGDPNSSMDISLSFNTGFDYCTVSAAIIVSKDSVPVTTSTLFIFTNVTNQAISNLNAFKILVLTSNYDLTLLGIYTFTFTYSWAGPTQRVETAIVTVGDACILKTSTLSQADIIKNLSLADSTLNVPPIFAAGYTMCKYSIVMTVTKNLISDTSAAAIQFNDMIQATYAQKENAVITFKTSFYNLSLIGNYIVTLNYSWNGPTTEIRTFKVTYVDPCVTAISPPNISNITKTLSDPNENYDVQPIFNSTYQMCTYSITMTITKDNSPYTQPTPIQFTNMINAPYSQLGNAIVTIATIGYNPSLAGVYIVSCTYTWNGPSSAIKSFQITIVDPCIAATVPPTSIQNITRNLSQPDLPVFVGPAINGPYASICFFSISITVLKSLPPDTSSSMIQFTNIDDAPYIQLANSVVTIATGTYISENAGDYSVTVVYSWNAPSTTSVQFNITIIDACHAATVPPATIQNVTRYLSDADFAINVAQTITDPYASACFFSIRKTVTKNSTPDTSTSLILFAEQINSPFSQLSSSILTIKTSYDFNMAGIYVVTLFYSWGGFSSVIRSFIVDVIDPCITLVTPPVTFADISLNLSKLDQFENVAPIITGTYASNCVFSIGIIITKTSTPDTTFSPFVWTDMVNAPFVDLNKGIVKIRKDMYDPNFAGDYNLQINYGWAGAQTATKTLKITILDPCLSKLTPPSAKPNQLIKYGDPNSALDISVSITSADYDFCTFSISLSTTQPEIVKFDQILTATVVDTPLAIINFVTDVPFLNPSVRGNSTITVDYSWGLTQTFQLIINLEVINQCESTKIRNQPIFDMQYQVAEQALIQEIPQFKDSVGEKRGIASCGLRAYTLTPDESIVTFFAPESLQQNPTLTLKTDDKLKVKTYIFNLKVCLVSYPAILCVQQQFTVLVNAPKPNQLPYFKPKLPQSLQFEILQPESIIMQWYFTLPPIIDDENDQIKVTGNFGLLDSFIKLNGQTILIEEIRESKTTMKPGFYPLYFTLDDGKNSTQFNVPLFINPPSKLIETQSVNVTQMNSTNTTTAADEQTKKDEDSLAEWLKHLTELALTGKISPLEKVLLSQADLATLQNGNMKELQKTNNFTEYLGNFASANYTGNLTSQEYMNLLMSDLNDLRTGYAVHLENNLRNPPLILDKKPPKPYVITASDTGRFVIGFTSDVFKVPDLRMINNGTIYLSDLQIMGNARLLKGLDWDSKAEQLPVLSFSVIPGDGQNEKDLGFNWNVMNQTSSQLDIQVHFDNPWAVSSGYSPDKMLIKFNDPMLFLGKNGFLIDRKTRVIEKILKRQSYSSSAQKTLDEALASAAVTGKVALVSNFVMNIFVSGALNQVLSMINVQQLIVQLPLLAIQMPASTVKFFGQLMSIASFDFIDVEAIVNKYFGMLPTGSFNQQFEDLGFSSTLFLNNLGTFAVVFLLYFVALFFLLCLKCCKKNQHVERLRMTLRELLVMNFLITTLFESYSQIVICCFINFKTIAWSTTGVNIQTSFAILFWCGCIVFPIWIIFKLSKKFDRLKSLKYRIMFSSFYEDLDLERGKKVFLQPAFFLARRIQLAAMVLFVTTFTWQFIFLSLHLVTAIVLLMLLQPFYEQQKVRAEMMNEVLLLIMFYHVMCFTPFVIDLQGQQYMGYSMVAFVALSIVYNISMIVFNSVQKGIRNFKIYLMLRKLKKQMKDRKLKIQNVLKNMKNNRNVESEDLEKGELNQNQVEQKQKKRSRMGRLQKKNRKLKDKLTKLAIIEEENEESHRSYRESSRIHEQEERESPEFQSEERNGRVSEEEKEVISSEETNNQLANNGMQKTHFSCSASQAILKCSKGILLASKKNFKLNYFPLSEIKLLTEEFEQIDQAIAESLEETKQPAFNSSILSTIDYDTNLLAQKPKADKNEHIFKVTETQDLQKKVQKYKNDEHKRKKSKVNQLSKPTLDDLVAEMNDKQRKEDERVKTSFRSDEKTQEQIIFHTRICEQEQEKIKKVQITSKIKPNASKKDFQMDSQQRQQNKDQVSQLSLKPITSTELELSSVKTFNFIENKAFRASKQKIMKELTQEHTQSAIGKNSSKEDNELKKLPKPILSSLEDIVASQQQSLREQDAYVDANWGDESQVRKQMRCDIDNFDSSLKQKQMENKNRGSSHGPKEQKLMHHKTDQNVTQINIQSLDSIVASMQVSKRSMKDSAYANWNIEPSEPKEEKSKVTKQGNLEDPYFEQIKTEGRKRSQSFAPKEPRPLFYANITNVSKEKIPDLDDLVEMNEQVKKDRDFENLQNMVQTRVKQAFRADPVQITQVDLQNIVQKRVMQAFKADPIKAPEVLNQVKPLKLHDEVTFQQLQEAAALKLQEILKGPTKPRKDFQQAWE